MAHHDVTPDGATGASEAPLLEHLAELRGRLLRSLAALFVTTLIALPLVTPALDLLLNTAQGVTFIAFSPLKPVSVFFKIAFGLGLALASPFIAYQAFSFVAPGLYPHEKRWLLLTLPGVGVLFVAGAAFALGVLVPLSVPVLQGFMPAQVTATYTLEAYLDFVVALATWMGVMFQVPLVVMVLTGLGLVRPAQLRRWRRGVIFGSAVLAAIITPTVDPFTMLMVTGPFVALYELGIVLSWLIARQRRG